MNLKRIQGIKFLYLASFFLFIIIGTIYLVMDLLTMFITSLLESAFYIALISFLPSLIFLFLSLLYLFKSIIKTAITFGFVGEIMGLMFIGMFYQYVIDYYNINYLQLATIILIIIMVILNFSLVLLKVVENYNKERNKVKDKILELSSKFLKVSIKDLSSLCNIDIQNVVKIILDLMRNKEIQFQYDKKKLIINYELELESEYIDQLISSYEEWELEKQDKK